MGNRTFQKIGLTKRILIYMEQLRRKEEMIILRKRKNGRG
jgi:hypothetical protein